MSLSQLVEKNTGITNSKAQDHFLDQWVDRIKEGTHPSSVPEFLIENLDFLEKILDLENSWNYLPKMTPELAKGLLPLKPQWYPKLSKYLKDDSLENIMGWFPHLLKEMVIDNQDNKEFLTKVIKDYPKLYYQLSPENKTDIKLIKASLNKGLNFYSLLSDEAKDIFWKTGPDFVLKGMPTKKFDFVILEDLLDRYPEKESEVLELIRGTSGNSRYYGEDPYDRVPKQLFRRPLKKEELLETLNKAYEEHPGDFLDELNIPGRVILDSLSDEVISLLKKYFVHPSKTRGVYYLPEYVAELPGMKNFLVEVVTKEIDRRPLGGDGLPNIDYFELPKFLKKSKEVVGRLIGLDHLILGSLDDTLFLDTEVIKRGLEQRPQFFQALNIAQRSDLEVAKFAVELHSPNLMFVGDPEMKNKLRRDLHEPNLPTKKEVNYKDMYVNWLHRYLRDNNLDSITKEDLKKLQGFQGVPIWDRLKGKIKTNLITPGYLDSLEHPEEDTQDVWRHAKYTYHSWHSAQRIFSGTKNYVYMGSIDRENIPENIMNTINYTALDKVRRAHPVLEDDIVLAWVRYTVLDEDNIWIDEIQSDLSKVFPEHHKDLVGNHTQFLIPFLKNFIKMIRSKGYESVLMPDRTLRRSLYPNSDAPTTPFEAAKKLHFKKKDIQDIHLEDLVDIKNQYKNTLLRGKVLVLAGSLSRR